jgi:phosphoglycolate phosphatase
MLHLAVERAGGGPAAMIGDSIVDVQTARAAGLPCMAVSFGFADRPADQLGADAVIDRFDQLLPALAAL